MYKSILKAINSQKIQKSIEEELHTDMRNSIKNRKPHFIFSVEHPQYPQENKLKMTHDQMLQFLSDRGYHAEPLHSKYGDEEQSIIIHNPPKHAINHLFKLAHRSGQESSIYSDGYNHEMHYHHGDNAGRHLKGQGTHHHKKEPEDFYSKTKDGTFFTHSFNWDEQHGSDKSMVNIKPENINKSERMLSRPTLIKNEEEKHPLETAGPETKMIHYSPKEGLKELDPKYHGVRGVGAETKQGQPKHPMSFFYLENTKPEKERVTSGAKSKYVAEKGKMKFYDIGKDPEGVYKRLKEKSIHKQTNPGIVHIEDYHQAIKDAGYHGIYNSSLGPTMRNVVGAFYRVPLISEHKIHPKDHKMTSAIDHHGDDIVDHLTRRYAKENQHHNWKFLRNLSKLFSSEKGEMKKSEASLQKGAARKRFPYNPQEVDEEEEMYIDRWQSGESDSQTNVQDYREMIPDISPAGKMRMLMKLANLTDYRKERDGSLSFLLHRGMHEHERSKYSKGGKINHDTTTSWTPRVNVAREMAEEYEDEDGNDGPTVSAWVNEKHLAHMPKMIGATRCPIDKDYSLEPKPKGSNKFDHESEIIVNPGHNSRLHKPKEPNLNQRISQEEPVTERSPGYRSQRLKGRQR